MTNASLLCYARPRPGLAGPDLAAPTLPAPEAARNADNVLDCPEEPLPGSVCEQFIRCGKLGCHCRMGKLHGPYYYRVWRGAGKEVHKVYVKGADVAQVRRQCASYLALSDELRAAMTRAVTLRSRLEGQIRRFHSVRQRRLDRDKEQLDRESRY